MKHIILPLNLPNNQTKNVEITLNKNVPYMFTFIPTENKSWGMRYITIKMNMDNKTKELGGYYVYSRDLILDKDINTSIIYN